MITIILLQKLAYFRKRGLRTVAEIWSFYLPDDILAWIFHYLFVAYEIPQRQLGLFLYVPWVNSLHVIHTTLLINPSHLQLYTEHNCLQSVGTVGITRQYRIPTDNSWTPQPFYLRNSLALKNAAVAWSY